MGRFGATEERALSIAIAGRNVGDGAARDEVRAYLRQRLAKLTPRIQRVAVRFEDENGPRGGIDTRCRIEVSVRGRPRRVAEARGRDARQALRRGAGKLVRALRTDLERHGYSAKERGAGRDRDRVRRGASAAAPRSGDEGSLIGRRVGRSAANLARALARPEKQRRDAYVDTAAPGVSASDRKAGYGATAARNTRARGTRMTATLEDSRTRPSRKSSRRSSNRAKAGTAMARREMLAQRSPKARARRAQVRRPRVR